MNMVEEKIGAWTGPVLLFDGVCNLCSSSVQWIIKRDKHARIKFASLQSEIGKALLLKHGIDPSYLNSLVYIENGKAYLESNAALKAARKLGGVYVLIYWLRIVPRFIRDAVYRWIGKNRYKWFGKKEACMIPTPALKSRFLDY